MPLKLNPITGKLDVVNAPSSDAGGGVWSLHSTGNANDGNNLSITSLDLDADKYYKIIIVGDGGNDGWDYMTVNSDATNYTYSHHEMGYYGGATKDGQVTSGSSAQVNFDLYDTTYMAGHYRLEFTLTNSSIYNADGRVIIGYKGMWWKAAGERAVVIGGGSNNTAAQVTSFQLHSTSAGNDYYWYVYKLVLGS